MCISISISMSTYVVLAVAVASSSTLVFVVMFWLNLDCCLHDGTSSAHMDVAWARVASPRISKHRFRASPMKANEPHTQTRTHTTQHTHTHSCMHACIKHDRLVSCVSARPHHIADCLGGKTHTSVPSRYQTRGCKMSAELTTIGCRSASLCL